MTKSRLWQKKTMTKDDYDKNHDYDKKDYDKKDYDKNKILWEKMTMTKDDYCKNGGSCVLDWGARVRGIEPSAFGA